MKAKALLISIFSLFLLAFSYAEKILPSPTIVNEVISNSIANNVIQIMNKYPLIGNAGKYDISSIDLIYDQDIPLCYVYHLVPYGHLVLSAHYEQNPIKSISRKSDFFANSPGYEKTVIDSIRRELNVLANAQSKNNSLTDNIHNNELCWQFWKNYYPSPRQILIQRKAIPIFVSEPSQDIDLSKDYMGKGKLFNDNLVLNLLIPSEHRVKDNSQDPVAAYLFYVCSECEKQIKENAQSLYEGETSSLSASISLIDNSIYTQADYSGDFVLTGAVQNNGTNASVFTKINVVLYDKNNNKIGTDYTYIYGGTNVSLGTGIYTNALRSGEKGFFKVWTTYSFSQVDHYTYTFEWSEYSYSLCYARLGFDGNPTTSSSLGDLRIDGQIKNSSVNYVSYFTQVNFAIYNSSSKVIDTDFTYVDGDSYTIGSVTTDTAIYPGQSKPFTNYTNAPYLQYSTYEYSFEWDEARTQYITRKITGKVQKDSTGLSGVTLTGLLGNPTTDSAGNYSMDVEYGWSGTVMPNKSGYSFSPSSRDYSYVTADQTSQDYSVVYAPTVSTTAASSITSTSAVSGGNVTSDNGAAVTDRGVCISTTANPTILNNHTHDGTGIGTFTSSLTSATPATTYHIRAYAANSAGTGYGSDLTFTTLSIAPVPTVTTMAISSLTKTSLMTGGNVTSEGSAAVTERGVCVGISANPTTANNHTHDGTGTGAFTSSLTNATPGTTYHVRAYATNAWGTSYGDDVSFRMLGGTKSDFNGDGQEDLLWRNFNTGENYIWYLGYSAAGMAGLQTADSQVMFQGLGSAKISGDAGIPFSGEPVAIYLSFREGGRPGQTVQTPGEGLEALGQGQSALTFSRPSEGLVTTFGLIRGGGASAPPLTDFNWKIAGTGDFNGDGKADILLSNAVTGEIGVWYMNGGTRLGAEYLPTMTDLNWQIVGTGDFNGDGKPDIVWRNSATGENGIWYMSGTTRLGADYLLTVTDMTWQIVGTGDFNGDGKTDIVWRNAVSGENYIWCMDGTTRIGGIQPPSVTDMNWQIVATGDYNQDGNFDIVWRNTVSGENAVWYMNGATRIGVEFLLTVADLSWRIVNR